ncbi:MAG: hypothetical protein WCW13_02285 [archaeon]|jgi:hypothetical protein
MVSITLSVPQETREKMKEFSEVNWSGFVRKAIEEKAVALAKLECLKKELEKEKEIDDWAVKLQGASRKGRLEELRKKGLI